MTEELTVAIALANRILAIKDPIQHPEWKEIVSDAMKITALEIKTEGPEDEPAYYKLPSGKLIYIARHDANFFYQLKKLPIFGRK
jgi:hypothetical protein